MGARNPCSTQRKIVWIWSIVGLISKVDTTYLELTCPLVFNEGSNVITCSVNQTHFNSACSSPLNNVQFNYKRPDGTQIIECETPNAQISNSCPSASSKGVNSTCLCSQRNGNMVTYELHFIGSKAQHKGITLQCVICFSQNVVDQSISASCSNITFDKDGGTTLDGNGSDSTPPSFGRCTSAVNIFSHPQQDSLAWIAAVVIIGSAVISGIVVIICHYAFGCKLCGIKGCVPCCKRTDTPVSKCAKYVSCEQNPCSKTKPSIRKP